MAEGEGELHQEFDLERASERLLPHLRFLSTVARLWQIATHQVHAGQQDQETLAAWLATARHNQERLLSLLDAIHDHPVPQPLGSYDSMVEYDRRRSVKEHLLYAAIATCLDASVAVSTLEGFAGRSGRHLEALAPDPLRQD